MVGSDTDENDLDNKLTCHVGRSEVIKFEVQWPSQVPASA